MWFPIWSITNMKVNPKVKATPMEKRDGRPLPEEVVFFSLRFRPDGTSEVDDATERRWRTGSALDHTIDYQVAVHTLKYLSHFHPRSLIPHFKALQSNTCKCHHVRSVGSETQEQRGLSKKCSSSSVCKAPRAHLSMTPPVSPLPLGWWWPVPSRTGVQPPGWRQTAGFSVGRDTWLQRDPVSLNISRH